MSERTPTLGEVIEQGALTVLSERCWQMPARVVSYELATQLVTVEPCLPILDDQGAPQRLPLLTVPVCWPRGGGWSIHLPLAAGDEVMLIIACRSLDEWYATNQQPAGAPADARVLALQDAVALPGVGRASAALSVEQARAGEVVLSRADGSVRIRLTATEVIVDAATIRLGSASANSLVALASLVGSELADIATALGQASTQLATLGQPGIVPPYSPSSVAATKTRAE
jgi:hypothetical protein